MKGIGFESGLVIFKIATSFIGSRASTIASYFLLFPTMLYDALASMTTWRLVKIKPPFEIKKPEPPPTLIRPFSSFGA